MLNNPFECEDVHACLISRVLNFVGLVKGQEYLCLPAVSWLNACVFKFCGVDDCLCAPEGLNFRIPACINACSRSLAVNKYLHMETKEKNLMYTRNKRATHEYTSF